MPATGDWDPLPLGGLIACVVTASVVFAALFWAAGRLDRRRNRVQRGFEVKPTTAGEPAARAETKEDGHHG
jgi:hypothetical protein